MPTLDLSAQSIENVLDSPETSKWLRTSLLQAISRDPVDATNDAELLFQLLSERSDAILSTAITASAKIHWGQLQQEKKDTKQAIACGLGGKSTPL